ncbi:TetR/AcrR family transcriptional regulator [Leuconostoc mesenteroides]|jgi:AcrR family transcriptional regulator|uniref:TetR family transcriptional regulator n=1 Tax=Leuconostoc mesenteroides TaxID=1245 RepID=A0A843Z4R9_LEUME|nr:TetR/AcrR family transcriptional regulator [Leuconostoc mesenteroides]MBZ1513539.1 TetR/AcrR family transcriptional regulator [Leuconostoc mesenteroides]MBZ1526832.1 TetR/AcrR family transcriptional regulator [Leuconostoc mesenteroides]MCH3953230.1 TetR/AcrR family transcriptional regulator [Leuconostoc mesenteroides]MCI2152949.1 TetR/AcrR family transcriptional regulator [Leuconostoc mesenteroides]MCI2168145.1 TetR/AcrR family transcriptional regulator [Leuconostoc mesenteroides]
MNRQEKNKLTQQRIMDAFVKLVSEKGFNNLTVSNITRTAKLSRGTFYIYYLDKYDVLEKIETYLLTNMEKLMQINIDKTISWLDDVDNNKLSAELDTYSPYRSFIRSFDFLDKNRFTLKTLLSKNGDSQFVYKLRHLIDEQIDSHYKNIFKDGNEVIPSDYTHDLLISSLISIIGHWLQKDDPESPAEIAEILIRSRILAAYQVK